MFNHKFINTLISQRITPVFAFNCKGFPSDGKIGSLQWKGINGEEKSTRKEKKRTQVIR